jgi:hypothetical protein
MNDRELDAKVAEKIMGWTLRKYETGEKCGPSKCRWYADDGWEWYGRDTDQEAHQWHPSTNIKDAWEVVEKMYNKFRHTLWLPGDPELLLEMRAVDAAKEISLSALEYMESLEENDND